MTKTDPQVKALNKIIQSENKSIFDLLSARGKAIYCSKKGIIGQSAQARGKKLNATIGIALNDNKSPLHLSAISKLINLEPEKIFPYASSFGLPEIRHVWKQMILNKNTSLKRSKISLPIVVAGLTHGLSISGYLFIDNKDKIITTLPFWSNYKLVFGKTYGAALTSFPLFDNQHFNLKDLKIQLNSKGAKKIVLLNFPNNPTGYTPTNEEINSIVEIFKQAANRGKRIVVFIDDAYFGLVYKKGVFKESIFAPLSKLHKNILAIKIDGVSKEDYCWGLRIGFVTYGAKGLSKKTSDALENKTAGAVRATISNAPRVCQSLLLRAFTSPDYQKEKLKYYLLLKRRFIKVQNILDKQKKYKKYFKAYPFNSGYFMSIKLKQANKAESVRQLLLKDFDTGIIAFDNNIRIAYASVPESDLELLFENIYQACCKFKS